MKYFIIAGEASGDLHASNLMRELKCEDSCAEFCFLGGDLMSAQGGKRIKHYRDMAFMGIISVVMHLRTVLNNLKDCKRAICDFQPDVVILVDYPSFNLRIAKFVKNSLGNVPVYYYISPKIWAWKEYRIKSIKKYIDKMYTILPFETSFYKKHNFEVTYVGNPCVDSVAFRPNRDESFDEFTHRVGLKNDRPLVALLSGSRKQEIKGCLPTMLKLVKNYPQFQFVVAGAPGTDPSLYKSLMADTSVKVIYNETYNLLQHSHSAVVNSGTATLETALFRVPQIVVYNVFGGIMANIIQSFLIKVDYVSLVNLIARKELVKELIAHYFNEKNLRYEFDRLLLQSSRDRIMAGYDEIINLLGEPGTAKHAATAIYKSLV